MCTPVQVERTAMSADMAQAEVERVLKDFMSDDRIQAEIAIAKKEGTSLAEKWGYAAEKAREILEGRNASDLTTEDNLNAIRSFSYISALTVVKEVPFAE